MKLRWKILIAFAAFAILMAASLTITMRVQLAQEVDAYKKTLLDKGEKLELSKILPPPTAPEENSADAVQAAFSTLGPGYENVPYPMQMVAPGKALIGSRQPDARNYDFTNKWDEFAATIEAKRPTIELLHQVLVHPKLDFNLDYDKAATMLFQHLAPVKRAALILEGATILELHNGNSGAAATNIMTQLAMVHKDYRDDLVISHLVRMALAAIAVPTTWELLQSTNVTDAQLAAVQSEWQQMNYLKDAETVFATGRAFSDMIILKTRSSHEEFIKIFRPTVSMAAIGSASSGVSDWPQMLEDLTAGPRAGIAEVLWRSSWSYSSELRMLQNNQVILKALRSMQTNQSQFYKVDYDTMSSRMASLGSTNVGVGVLRVMKIPDFREYYEDRGLSPAVRKTLQSETARRVVITAIALTRFQLKHGRWPKKLGDLIPEFIPSVPIDPFDGKPLKYHPNLDGTFLLYSVGEDGIDDGGDAGPPVTSTSSVPPNWLRARDWVWPQPATPAEIQYFYEHPPK